MKNYPRPAQLIAFHLIAFATVLASAQAQEGIAFGWNEALTQEGVYRVSLVTGVAQQIGIVDGLKYVAMGSHAVDPRSGNGLMVGQKDNSENSLLFLMIPADGRTFSFALDGSSRRVYQQAFVHPRTGAMKLLTYDTVRQVNEIYSIALDLKKGKLLLNDAATVPGITAFVVGNPKITSDGKIIIPAVDGGGGSGGRQLADGETTSIVSFDLATGASSSFSARAGITNFAVCETAGTAQYFGYSIVRNEAGVVGRIIEIGGDGSVVERASAAAVATMQAGSAFCAGGIFYLLGTTADGTESLFSLNTAEATSALGVTPLSENNLKFIAPLEARPSRTAAARVASTGRFDLIPAASLKACVARYRNVFKKQRYTTIRSATSLLAKFRFSKRGSGYSCNLK